MSRAFDRRLADLETENEQVRAHGTTMARVTSVERVLAGTATTEDYERACPGLLDHMSHRVDELAFWYLVDRISGLPHRPVKRPAGSQAKVLENVERLKSHWDPEQRARGRLLWWAERLNLKDGPDFDLIAHQCSYFEHHSPPPGLRDQIRANANGGDLEAKVRAHFYLVLVDEVTELRMRRSLERRAPRVLFDIEGMEGRGQRFIDYYRYHCHGDVYDVNHDRLPASCYTPEGPKNCGCVRKSHEVDWVPALNARIKRDRDEWARRIGARLDVPDGP